MIPSNLVDRMKLVADFDGLILRHMMIELGVQTFCRPAGAASEILTMFEESFRQDRAPEVSANGHVKRGRPALPPSAAEPEKGAKANRNAQWYKAAAERRAQDPWHTADWRKEIFRFAAEHDGVFNLAGYGGYYHSQYHRNLSDTRVRSTIADMRDRQHYLKKMASGTFAVTEAGRKAASELGINFSSAVARKALPAKKVAPAVKKAAPVKKHSSGRLASQGPASPEMLQKFARAHDGNIFASEFMKEFKTSAGSTYTQLAHMQADKLVEKVKPGHFRVIEGAATASA